MYKLLTKYGQTGALLVGIAVTAIFLITVMSGLSSAGYDMGTDLNALDDEAKAAIGFFNTGLWLTIVLAVIAIALAFVVFGVWDLIKYPKQAIKFLIGFVVLLVIFFILYSSANPEVVGFEDKMIENDITPGISKFISAGIWTTIGLGSLAFLAMVLSEIRNAFK